MSFSRLPDYDGKIQAPKLGLGAAALAGMAALSWLQFNPVWMAANVPALLHNAGFPAVVSFIFYSAWTVHLLEAFYALYILATHKNWLRTSTAFPWFLFTFLLGYPQLSRLMRSDKERRPMKKSSKRI